MWTLTTVYNVILAINIEWEDTGQDFFYLCWQFKYSIAKIYIFALNYSRNFRRSQWSNRISIIERLVTFS